MISPIILGFEWTPLGAAFTYTLSGNTYPYVTQEDAIVRDSDYRYESFITTLDTLLTFTALTSAPPGVSVIEYKWNFGDGKIGYGQSVTHTYKTPAAQTSVTLRITDNKNRKKSVHKILNLRFGLQSSVSGYDFRAADA